MKTIEEKAFEFSEQFIDPTDENSNYEAQAALIGFSAGYKSAQKENTSKLINYIERKYGININKTDLDNFLKRER